MQPDIPRWVATRDTAVVALPNSIVPAGSFIRTQSRPGTDFVKIGEEIILQPQVKGISHD
jgi:hypothetical protein